MQEDLETRNLAADKSYRQALRALFVKVSLYYILLGGSIGLILYAVPGLIAYLPIGGLSGIAGGIPDGSVEGLQSFDLSNQAALASRDWLVDGARLALAMLSTIGLMIPVTWVHLNIHQDHEYDHSIDETALILPAVVAGVVTVIQHSLALAFGLAGIVAGVRFRRALTDTFDTLFIFVAIGVGLAAGVGAIEVAVVTTVFFTYATTLSCMFGDGLESKFVAQKQIERKRLKAEKKNQSGVIVKPPSDV